MNTWVSFRSAQASQGGQNSVGDNSYPWSRSYRLWPRPNSKTFVAWVARLVPELDLDLPSTAIGKDYLGPTTLLATAPSGTGWQVSALGLVGATLARFEGLELNLLGLSVGIDLDNRRLRVSVASRPY